ncbi:MAG TPA: acyl-CoA dehydrogenase family protein [Woeseiaceae bacterium]
MALIFNEEQQMLRDAAKTFIGESSPVARLRELRDRGEAWSPDLWSGMADMGWTGITIAEQFGGLDFGYVGAGIILEECGRTLAASPLLSSSMVCADLVATLGSEQQKSDWLPGIASGEWIVSLALNEADRFDPGTIAATAVADGSGFALAGTKRHVPDAPMATHFLVVACTNGQAATGDDLSLCLVDRNAAGLGVTLSLNLDARRVGELQLDAVRIDADRVIGLGGGAGEGLQRALDIAAALSAAELLGLAQEAFERTVGYLKERKQFGVPIGSFQALQHRAAQLFAELELCKSVVLKALQAIDADAPDRSLLASAAKAKVAKTARLAVNEAVQMHGGIGMTDDFDLGFFMKRAAAAVQEYGDDYYHADRFGRLSGY